MIVDVDSLYFKWLVNQLERPIPALARLCGMLHHNTFTRRVGNDVNRAVDGENLRRRFLDEYGDLEIEPSVSNDFLNQECSWFEMLVALSEKLDYLYDSGVQDSLIELIENMGLGEVIFSHHDEFDQQVVDTVTTRIDHNRFTADGQGGLFPLVKDDHPDQRGVEIWDQHAAYFSERLEGMWTS